MSARILRRRFAAPFVITTVAAAACSGPTYTNPPHPNPPGPEVYTDAPPAEPTEPPTHPENPPPPREPMATNPPRPVDPGPPVVYNPPPPRPPVQTYDTDRTWLVRYWDGECHAFHETHCPQNATCNPPPPVSYYCPASIGTDEKKTATIVQPAGSVECFLNEDAPKCPKNAKCAPAEKTAVICPDR